MTTHKPPTPGPACGTHQGYHRHKYRGENPCMPCADARLLYKQDRRHAAKRRAVLAEAVGDGSYGGTAGGS